MQFAKQESEVIMKQKKGYKPRERSNYECKPKKTEKSMKRKAEKEKIGNPKTKFILPRNG